jgi:DNA-binding response OmpR family regulator
MSKKTILIVDDNEDLTKGLKVLLRSHDYATVIAGDAVSAISTAKSEKPDLVILDLGLPAGDGYLVMERLSNIPTLSATPVIVVSARDREGHYKRSFDAGAKAFLQKPVDKEVLLSTIEKVLMGESGLHQL